MLANAVDFADALSTSDDKPLDLGTLAGKLGLNIKVAEDILAISGITPPYMTDGGNLTLEFTIEVADVVGAAQVFPSDFGFGTYPLQRIQ